MHIVKRLLRGSASQVFKLAVVFLALSAAFALTFGTSDQLKSSLKDSGVFGSVVDSVLDESKKEQGNDVGSVPLDDPAVREAANKAFSPQFLEQTSSQIIDGMYGWLQGKTDTPEFQVDLKDAKNKLANMLGDVAATRARKLKVCTTQQLLALDRNDLNLFSLPCLPPGVNINAERAKLVREVSRSNDFLEDTTFSADDLPKENGQTLAERASFAPIAFEWLTRLPWILSGLMLLGGLGLVFLHDQRRRGIWIVGRTLLAAGIFLLIATFVVRYLASDVNFVELDKATALQDAGLTFVRSMVAAYNRALMTFAIAYIIVGGAIMLAIRLTQPKATTEQKAEAENSAEANNKTSEQEADTKSTETKLSRKPNAKGKKET